MERTACCVCEEIRQIVVESKRHQNRLRRRVITLERENVSRLPSPKPPAEVKCYMSEKLVHDI